MRFSRKPSFASQLGAAIGKGILAGVVGTAAITLSQMIEMRITGRESSDAPVKAADEVLGVKPKTPEQKELLSQEMHWAYGTAWGIARGLISLTGLKGLPASLLHLGAVWGTSMIMLPALKAAPPVTEETPEEVGVDGLHHAIYAVTTGIVYDAMK
ncbi:MAG: hypothetical protein INR69_16680 [Mucilaginibacter polytrichastri]|nr:hypothetical protein [Mucilaginibacter polytrichastri]